MLASANDLDHTLTAQLIIAWAGESGVDDPRLGWWNTDLASEFGGEDFFRRLLPTTWPWAIFRALLEAARRVDAAARRNAADPDQILSLFNLGFELDEHLSDRFDDLARTHTTPLDALPALAAVIGPSFSHDRFESWVRKSPRRETETTSIGRRLHGAPPTSLTVLVDTLVSALTPIAPSYPLPHYRLAPA